MVTCTTPPCRAAVRLNSGVSPHGEIPVSELPYEYCALRFLLQWETAEKHMRSKFQSDLTTSDLRRALKHFQIARNFKGLRSEEVATSVINQLLVISASKKPPESKVTNLANSFKGEFGKFNLSAASKLLWLKQPKGVIIYDSRAVSSLRQMGWQFRKADYEAYCQAWRTEFNARRKEIRAAAKRLPEAASFLPTTCRNKKLDALIRNKSFVERVFDIYLWETGAEG